MSKSDFNAFELPEDSASLRSLVLELLSKNDEQQRCVDEQNHRIDAQRKQTESLQVELVRVKLELERYKKWYYGPRADRLQSDQDVAQMLLNFSEALDQKPINAEDLPRLAEPAEELRRVKRRKGRRNLANFENLPVTTHVYELS